MYVHESVLHYAVAFLERYNVENKNHQEAVKELRLISNQLLETLKKPQEIKVIRHIKKDD